MQRIYTAETAFFREWTAPLNQCTFSTDYGSLSDEDKLTIHYYLRVNSVVSWLYSVAPLNVKCVGKPFNRAYLLLMHGKEFRVTTITKAADKYSYRKYSRDCVRVDDDDIVITIPGGKKSHVDSFISSELNIPSFYATIAREMVEELGSCCDIIMRYSRPEFCRLIYNDGAVILVLHDANFDASNDILLDSIRSNNYNKISYCGEYIVNAEFCDDLESITDPYIFPISDCFATAELEGHYDRIIGHRYTDDNIVFVPIHLGPAYQEFAYPYGDDFGLVNIRWVCRYSRIKLNDLRSAGIGMIDFKILIQQHRAPILYKKGRNELIWTTKEIRSKDVQPIIYLISSGDFVYSFYIKSKICDGGGRLVFVKELPTHIHIHWFAYDW